MWQDYTDVVRALRDLIDLNTVGFDRIFTLGVIGLIILSFSIFRRKEHI